MFQKILEYMKFTSDCCGEFKNNWEYLKNNTGIHHNIDKKNYIIYES